MANSTDARPDGCGIVLDDDDVLTDDELDGFTLFAGVDEASVSDQAEKWLALRTPEQLDEARRVVTKTVSGKGRVLWLADVLRAAGLRVVEVQGWQTRGKAGLTPLFQMFHHTASRAGYNAPALRICTDGRSDLPGPLCQVLVARDGTCFIVASGIANHAGRGEFPDGTTAGNSNSLGWECENNGVGEPWSAAQLTAIAVGQAAVCRHTNRPALSVVGHREYARPRGRKPDPRNVDLLAHRARVADLIQEDDDMLTPEQADQLNAVDFRLKVHDQALERIEKRIGTDNKGADLSDEMDVMRRSVRALGEGLNALLTQAGLDTVTIEA